MFTSRPSLHIHTPSLFQVELETDCWEWVDMLWCQGAQNIGLSHRKLKSVLKCTVLSQCTSVPERLTDRRRNIMAIARRFVLWTHRTLKCFGLQRASLPIPLGRGFAVGPQWAIATRSHYSLAALRSLCVQSKTLLRICHHDDSQRLRRLTSRCACRRWSTELCSVPCWTRPSEVRQRASR